jgi:hypothetical protein
MNHEGNWNWSFNLSGGNISESGNLSAGSVEVAAPAGFYSLRLTDDYGYSVFKNVEVKSKQQAEAAFTVIRSRKFIESGDEIFFNDASLNVSHNEWDFGDGSLLSDVQRPSHTYSYPGVYDITLRAWNDECEDAIVKHVSVGMPAVIHFIPGNLKSDEIYKADEADEVFIYGNEESIFVKFSFKEKADALLYLYDITGRQLHTEKVVTDGMQKITKAGLPGAVYFVKVVVKDRIYSGKVLLGVK